MIKKVNRSNPDNKFNKQYFESRYGSGAIDVSYAKVHNPGVQANKDWTWGKMLDGSFSVMDSEYREPEAHELWIVNNKTSIGYMSDPTWKNIQSYWSELEQHVSTVFKS